jgi:hypothetical protein
LIKKVIHSEGENRKNSLRINDLEVRYAKVVSENQKMKANKTCFFYLLRECMLRIKKKKNSLGNALRMIEEEEDVRQIKKILSDFKIKL